MYPARSERRMMKNDGVNQENDGVIQKNNGVSQESEEGARRTME